MKRYALASAIALMAAGFAMPAAAAHTQDEPVVLAMASYATLTAGEDAAVQVAQKKAAYAAHAERDAAGDCHDCEDCPDCDDCVECADCIEQKEIAEAKAGICDPAEHAKGEVKHG